MSFILILLPALAHRPSSSLAATNFLPAFTGAEGFGAKSVGGRGGRVIEVTNINDSGPGSFRKAINARGPRIVVFRVGGTINLLSGLSITKPYLTIAGQTAPGGGIALKGVALVIRTHDIVIRGLRIRVGDTTPLSAPDGMRLDGTGTSVYNVIIDHCSVSWSIDENLSPWSPGNPATVHDVTFQWNISSEGLAYSIHPKGLHSDGMLVYNAHQVSVHHNLFAHNYKRNPKLSSDTSTEVINNVIYDWGDEGTHIADDKNSGDPTFANIIGNYYKSGLSTLAGDKGMHIKDNTAPGSKLYVKGNIGPGRSSNSQPEWDVVDGSTTFQSSTPPLTSSGITSQIAFQAYDLVLQKAGALPPDSADQRVRADVKNGTGRIIDSQNQVGGWPLLQDAQPPQDSDHDGMPDDWEIPRGLNPNVDDSAGDRDGDGYTNIEEYINSLI